MDGPKSLATPSPVGRHICYAVACLVATAALAAAYSNHFDNGFHFDDAHVITNNLAIRGLSDPLRFFTDPHTFTARPQNAAYRPLLTLSFALDYRLGNGLDPRTFHRTQFALLLALGVLLTVFLKQLYDAVRPDPWNRSMALVGATLFSIHTANTQTVNYLSARSSLVATLGVIAAFVVYLGWPRGRRTLLYLVPMVGGGLAKPLAVMFAPLLFAYVLLIDRGQSLSRLLDRDGLRAAWNALVRSLPALVVGAALFALLRRMDAPTLEYASVDRWTYARTQPFVWLHYFRLFLLPRGLTADTDWRFFERWSDPRVLAGAAFVAALVVAIVIASRRRSSRPIAFGLAWFAIALLPTSSLVPLSEVYNEHRIFFPFVGLAAAAVWSVAAVVRRSLAPRPAVATAVALTCVVLAIHGVGTFERNRVWRDGRSLWRDVTIKSPNNPRGLMNYGLTLMREGELEEALDHYERAERLEPRYSVLQVNLGIVKSALGRPAEAEPHFRRALELTPGYAAGHFYYARWLAEHERAPEALRHLRRALAISPADAGANRMLLDLYAATGNEAALASHARSVLRIAPSDPAAKAYLEGRVPYDAPEESALAYARLGFEKIQRGEWLEAAAIYRHALGLDPDSASSWNDLGWSLANAGYHGLAIPCFRRAIELEPDHPLAPGNLRWAQERYRSGDGAP